ncbi:hypothetical protein CR513_50131, partial [Mucuna pruriens]
MLGQQGEQEYCCLPEIGGLKEKQQPSAHSLENKVGEKAKEIDTTSFKLWYTGKVRGKNGVGIIVDKGWKDCVICEGKSSSRSNNVAVRIG